MNQSCNMHSSTGRVVVKVIRLEREKRGREVAAAAVAPTCDCLKKKVPLSLSRARLALKVSIH